MSPAIKEIEQPLGLAKPPKRRDGRRFVISGRSFGTTSVAILLLAVSSAIAFRDKPFRAPAVVAVAAPEIAEPAKPEAAQTPPPASASSQPGPSIIRVDPENQGSGSSVVIVRDPSAVGQNLRVAHLPDRALIEQSENGPLPIRAADGRRPFDVYAAPWSGARGARVAIVIGGLAVSQTGTQQAIEKLPSEVTLAFASQGNSIGRWMQAARRKGHEIMMQVPLEPFDYPNVNPGRSTLTVEASPEENTESLLWTLGRTTNYTGVMNYMGARFSADAAAMAPMMAELGKRGLMYLDDGSVARSAASGEALKSGVPFAEGDTTIDAVRERGEILKKLDELERTARAKGFAIGTGSAFDVTVDAVAAWVNEAKKRGIEIVPVSAVASDPERG
ncbi:divergent polysaccharide deacetylase family protein [Mesorhizobium sp. ZC-5]|uniref:divergent polysaccharide deacetylase family protein n=1 Tax=Mesorhizobium sp. ZC-5 TaxID=2986066 RepID=UPI0021E86E3B|nr:divergent polysaccharide deacetylase family protein [Mesorhizobium sp. ZC-5]MCV3238963.1 divergent polysaccharide deacetylase family protein [Mesorhizobium sp. ZC-5]